MMAQRKGMMRIIRQDAGFSAKLGFGGKVGASELADRETPVQSTSIEALAKPKPSSPAIAVAATPSGNTGEVGVRSFWHREEFPAGRRSSVPERLRMRKLLVLYLGQLRAGMWSMSHCR